MQTDTNTQTTAYKTQSDTYRHIYGRNGGTNDGRTCRRRNTYRPHDRTTTCMYTDTYLGRQKYMPIEPDRQADTHRQLIRQTINHIYRLKYIQTHIDNDKTRHIQSDRHAYREIYPDRHIHAHVYMHRHTDTQTNKQTIRNTDTHTYRQTIIPTATSRCNYRPRDRQTTYTDIHPDIQTSIQIHTEKTCTHIYKPHSNTQKNAETYTYRKHTRPDWRAHQKYTYTQILTDLHTDMYIRTDRHTDTQPNIHTE